MELHQFLDSLKNQLFLILHHSNKIHPHFHQFPTLLKNYVSFDNYSHKLNNLFLKIHHKE
ncbi:hypothetical protein GLOIN_2v1609046 [Rhizophagus irregularis DAOM 181602=DAOM 197198]|uniref:Uncharacterized protein n=1 Tax=Rhizophagus irregularis (strain DAOM 181602 / DAOM 197198 / MUCL 43194) TaxID=747089 RepID=A0A2P4Q0J4_RHIID|nr:hypothetical protein GLOIN_2v1609046 [Rhizophagus irregularis DAOM 181602=DAOM 197198]POG71150.1 hypothetical protein GLOIN_2v1609046 [Rhizophagus irregularis DAOM 181602=DAOM 197198]|eukprot:XP_025178016.1 hypothetical protein GLOIN_2v1609046 [Rhizophagus irregularis DAOM 181602=DAOM 197198]